MNASTIHKKAATAAGTVAEHVAARLADAHPEHSPESVHRAPQDGPMGEATVVHPVKDLAIDGPLVHSGGYWPELP